MTKQRRTAEHFARALRFHQTGHLQEAEALYRQICTAEPNHAGAWHRLAVLAHQLGRKESVHFFQRAIELQPNSAELQNDFGVVLGAQGRFSEAISYFARAVELNPNYTEAHNNLGHAHQRLGQLDQARAHYEKAAALNPSDAMPHVYLGNVIKLEGQIHAALAHYDKALALDPKCVMAHYHLALAYREHGQLEEAITHYRIVTELTPRFVEAHNNLGTILRELGQSDAALGYYEKAVAYAPKFAEAHMNLANFLSELGRHDAAISHYEAVTALRPDFLAAHYDLGIAHRRRGAFASARACFERTLAISPDHAEARLALAMTQLPILYRDAAEIAERRSTYRESLSALRNEVSRVNSLSALADAIGSYQPFYLAYQGMNDRDLQALYGSIVCDVMAARYGPVRLPPPPLDGEPLRVGFVSGFFYRHSNWKIPVKGWVANLDRNRFRIFGYSTGQQKDAETLKAGALCERFAEGSLSIENWRDRIAEDAPHILIYPEIGMDKTCAQLAAQRLAPVQCVSWGHPTTSGFPTIDYFLSSALMEPPEADDHYTERLVRLPNLSIYYEPPDLPSAKITRADLGLSDDALVYWCSQSISKYLPQFDEVFPRIAREIGNCQFTFIEFPGNRLVTEEFKARLSSAFAAFGLKASDHCVILPRFAPEQFTAAIGTCDIFLDSIGWSGCNSTLESLSHDLPIVTMKTGLMRGGHTTAILEMMGLNETIAATLDDYVAIAVRLAKDIAFRTTVKTKIANGKHRLYGDKTCVNALEDFLVEAMRGKRAPT